MQHLSFVLTPMFHIHLRNDEPLRALAHEVIHHPRVAQVITNRDPDLSPGGVPDAPLGGGQSIGHELHGDGFDLLEYILAIRADDESCVVELMVVLPAFASSNQI